MSATSVDEAAHDIVDKLARDACVAATKGAPVKTYTTDAGVLMCKGTFTLAGVALVWTLDGTPVTPGVSRYVVAQRIARVTGAA